MAYIKSHSNYVLKSKHQNVSDGTIWERDITTIGGVNQFAPGQIPIYRSNNFIISIRNEGTVSNQFNKKKWYENSSGTVWTLENVNEMASSFDDENDTKIVLKQDYFDFNDFAYYGSLSELFRSSINDIFMRFPGELYFSIGNPNVYFKADQDYVIGDETNWSEMSTLILGGSQYHEVSNPFGINIHSTRKLDDEDALKYFANDGYKNYQVFINDSTEGYDITRWTPPLLLKAKYCPGDKIGDISIVWDGGNFNIECFVGDGNQVYYLSSGSTSDEIHIRPKEEFLAKFYNECNNFEKIILNPKTTPKYKASFSVIKDNEKGFYREMEDFIFPTSFGGYNVDASSYGFNSYTTRLSEIGTYYDEYFTDNLYRAMTHEAIKNFDWTFTREFYEDEKDKYVPGGEKIQKALRIFAREFDEIKMYIDNIANFNNITYDERNNVPDYFLTDMCEDKGWDVILVTPYDLKEVFLDNREEVPVSGENSGYTLEYQLSNSTFEWEDDDHTEKKNQRYFVRQFSQASKNEVQPYSKEKIPQSIQNGYFILGCPNGGDIDDVSLISCGYFGSNYSFKEARNAYSYYDNVCECDNKLKYRIKSYTDERTYSYLDANNEFLRRLSINSPHIFRKKGTVEGIEMILGMFGLKSKRWVEKNNNCKYSDKNGYDYEVIEYSSFANRIEEQWDEEHQMYRLDWINKAKTIQYDNRSISRYSGEKISFDEYLSYQGIPVAYRDEYLSADTPYIAIQELDTSWEDSVSTTNVADEAFRMLEDGNKPVLRRYLYPQYNKDEALDGNPYFQMDGGWLSKTIGNENNKYNFQFDTDDNVVYTIKIDSGYTTDDGTVIDDEPLYKETVRNIRRVDTIDELLSIPKVELHNGIIVYVSYIEDNVAVLGDKVYKIKEEVYSSDTQNENDDYVLSQYIELVKSDGIIEASSNLFFDEKITVYDRNGAEVEYDVGSMYDGSALKCYIIDGDVIVKSTQAYASNSFTVLTTSKDDTNYFLLNNVDFNDTLVPHSDDGVMYGWRRLTKFDCNFLKINTIENYYKGNNPHNGRMVYDSGREYFSYFKHVFKYAYDNDMFSPSCFGDDYEEHMAEAYACGFNGLVDNNDDIRQYTPFLVSGDSKIHYFGNYKTRDVDNNINGIYIYGEDKEMIENAKTMYFNDYSGDSETRTCDLVSGYTLSGYEISYAESEVTLHNAYSDEIGFWIPSSHTRTVSANTNLVIDPQNDESFKLWVEDHINTNIIDESTHQIMNNKRLTIIFNLHNQWYTNEGQTEVKYLDNIVMNYLTQMIPSTTIVDIEYRDSNAYD